MDQLWAERPRTTLTACGREVGLPEGQMGNSEVGHLNLGAGAVVKQDLTRIDEAVETGALAQNEILRAAYEGAPRVHLVGLVSDGGVHSGWEHLQALIGLGKELGVPELVIHAFTDGRDTSPTGGRAYLAQVQEWCDAAGNARIGTVIGRYFGMDRDRRWERTQQAYDLLVHGIAAQHVDTAAQAIEEAYGRDETDEFITATTIGDEATIRPGDSVIAFNFRPDRVRQISLALADPRSTRSTAARHRPSSGTSRSRVRRDLPVPDRLPAGASDRHAAEGDRRAWRHPAARRRDREVPARDVLLRRR